MVKSCGDPSAPDPDLYLYIQPDTQISFFICSLCTEHKSFYSSATYMHHTMLLTSAAANSMILPSTFIQ